MRRRPLLLVQHCITLSGHMNHIVLHPHHTTLPPASRSPHRRRDLVGSERVLGPDHPDTLTAIHNMAVLLYKQGRLSEAEPLYRCERCGSCGSCAAA